MTKTIEDKARAVLLRAKNDFRFYAENFVKIKAKGEAGEEAKIVPFRINKAQEQLLQVIEKQMAGEGKVRIIILKARQQGFSTFVHAWLYWHLSFRKAKKALVIAHDAEATDGLFDMYKRTHDNMIEPLRPPTKYSSKKELVFGELDTAIKVATAGGKAVGRSQTLTHGHVSEVA